MQINLSNNKTHFKSSYVIQIPKSKFINPENITECDNAIRTAINRYIPQGEKCGYFEQPLWDKIITMLNEAGLSVNWLKEYSKIPINGPIDENHHSFWLFTKETKDKILKEHSPIKHITRGFKVLPNQNSEIKKLAAMNQSYIEDFSKIIAKEPVNLIKVKDWTELFGILPKIEW